MTNEMREYLLNLYNKCLGAKYTHLRNDADYAVEIDGNTMYLLFQWSNSTCDWFSNLDFFPEIVKPYKDMENVWQCHEGFLRVWKEIKKDIEAKHTLENLTEKGIEKIVCVGYSHGAAIAALAHEYVWFNFPEIRENLTGYGFGAPRIFYGKMTDELAERWKTFYPIRSGNDIVTHVPPRMFKFRHVNEITKLGTGKTTIKTKSDKKWWPKFVCAHTPTNYRNNIQNGEAKGALANK